MQGINLQCNTALHHITSHCTTIASYYIHCTAIRVGQHQSETVHYPRTCIIRNCIAFLVWRYIALHSTGLQIYRNCTAFKVRQHQSETVHYSQGWYGAMHCICMYHAVQDIVQECIHYTKLRCSVSHYTAQDCKLYRTALHSKLGNTNLRQSITHELALHGTVLDSKLGNTNSSQTITHKLRGKWLLQWNDDDHCCFGEKHVW